MIGRSELHETTKTTKKKQLTTRLTKKMSIKEGRAPQRVLL